MDYERFLKDMILHAKTTIDGFDIIRVINGWIYYDRDNKISTFVPEFIQ